MEKNIQVKLKDLLEVFDEANIVIAHIEGVEEGFYDPETQTIYIDPHKGVDILRVLVHEMIHHLHPDLDDYEACVEWLEEQYFKSITWKEYRALLQRFLDETRGRRVVNVKGSRESNERP